ncbi:MAG: LPS export ABC transporter permease LptF [Desulfobacterales bacterium]|nr:LPS export ABC transporter permease LptF [Desulfobacterales bacterium]
MRFNTIIHRYLIKELIPPFVLSLVFFSFIFLMQQILEITNLIVNYQVGIMTFGLMLIYSMPYFLVYIIPMAVMMSVLLSFLRMSGDNEITALKAGGVSLYQLLPPVLVFGVFCAILTAFMAVYGMPWGSHAHKMLALDAARSNFNIGLKEKQFNDSFDDVTFYVNQVDLKNRMLEDVFIEDQRKAGMSSTVVAPKGHIFSGAEEYSFVLRLYEGMINRVDLDERSAHTIRFDTYDLQLNFKSMVSDIKGGRKDEKEMSLSELTAYLKSHQSSSPRYYSVLLEFHKKFSIPAASIALALLAVPLGVRSASSRRSAGLGIGLFAFLIYYLLLSAGMVMGEAGIYPPVIGMWVPNVVMGGCGVYLLVKAAKDQPIWLGQAIRSVKNRLIGIFIKYSREK